MIKTYQWTQEGREELQLEIQLSEDTIKSANVQAVGCLAFLEMSKNMQKLISGPISQLQLPEGNDHSSMIWREIISQIQEEWQSPVTHEEVCHCRRVSTEAVDRAVVYGAHTIDAVRKRTSANTGCGTCKEDVLSLINNRLVKE